jgi:hypothetical protein
MPYWHVKVLDKEGTHRFIQSVKQKKPATQFQIMNIIHIMESMYIMLSPKNRSRRFYPVLAGSHWSEEIHRNTILVMLGNASIKATHIGQRIVNISVVQSLQGTYLALINAYFVTVPPCLGPYVIRNIQWTKPVKPCRKAAKNIAKIK